MNRRELLVAGGGLLLRDTARGAPGVIRAGILGTRHSHTSGKLKAMQDSPDYEVAAVCEPDPAARARAEKDPRFKGLRWVSEGELLADTSIRLVVVECQVWEALPWGRKVIQAGKHLHIEKPPGNDWPAFKALVEEARSKKLLLQTGYVWRWHAGVNAALEAARKGWLGEVFMIRGTMNADRDTEQRAVEARYRGGGMFELGGHVIDRIVDLLGRPVKVQTWLRHHTGVADKLADNNVAVLEFEKALATVTQSAKMSGAGDHRSFEVIGTDGTIMVWPESSPPRMRVHLRKAQGPYSAGWQDITLPPQPRFVGDFQELARAIKTEQPLKLSYDHELLLQETLLRASGELS
jgi:predicted dehydrogenase